jgi:hypothetical protein
VIAKRTVIFITHKDRFPKQGNALPQIPDPAIRHFAETHSSFSYSFSPAFEISREQEQEHE